MRSTEEQQQQQQLLAVPCWGYHATQPKYARVPCSMPCVLTLAAHVPACRCVTSTCQWVPQQAC